MKPNGTFTVRCPKTPIVLIDPATLTTLKHIVDSQDGEVQWFHRVDKLEDQNNIVYYIYETYIPRQVVSSTEVDTSPTMMVDFFRELMQKYGMEEANKILQSMTVWCHSHSRMATSPSGQDNKQFAQQIELALQAQQTTPQIMFIWNKSREYYCRIYEPQYGLEFLHVPIELATPTVDLTDVGEQLKAKLSKKVYAPITPYRSTFSPPAVGDWQKLAKEYGYDLEEVEPDKKKEQSENSSSVINIQLTSYIENMRQQVGDLLDITNTTKRCDKEIDELIEIISSKLAADEIAALDLLLEGSPREIERLANGLCITTEEEEGHLHDLQELFSDGIIETDMLLGGIQTVLDLAFHFNKPSKSRSKILDNWLLFLDQFYDAIESTTSPGATNV